MKIAKVEQFFPRKRGRLVKITTDNGLVGWGECTLEGRPKGVRGVIEELADYLVGKDPLRIEHHWQYLYRWTHFRGAAIMGALSAIDIALWDIAGKHFGVPAYQLLGGKCRDRARVYYHVFGDTKEKLIQGCVEAKEMGFNAVGHLTPFLDQDRSMPFFKTHADKMRDAIETVRLYREAAEYARGRGIIIADTKFEFGLIDGELSIIDEMLTPDSSRFWDLEKYEPGREQDSMDKQILRNYLETLDWNRQYPPPHLDPKVLERVAAGYVEIFHRLFPDRAKELGL